MPSIKTLIKDIYDRISSSQPYTKESVTEFASNLATRLSARLGEEQRPATLRLSNLGSRCRRKLWYSINKPGRGDPLSGPARLKFLFGDILEEVLLWLAKEAGHKVEREQERVELHGVVGHIDAVVDGELVDCKSASTASFRKFNSGDLPKDDPFGYISQLESYLNSTPDISDRGHFLVVDKTLGNLCLDTHKKTDTDYEKIVSDTREMLKQPLPPLRGYEDEKHQESGNRKLGVACSYCQFKSECWPGLRTFLYAKGPVFLTKVVKKPDVKEITNAVQEDWEG